MALTVCVDFMFWFLSLLYAVEMTPLLDIYSMCVNYVMWCVTFGVQIQTKVFCLPLLEFFFHF